LQAEQQPAHHQHEPDGDSEPGFVGAIPEQAQFPEHRSYCARHRRGAEGQNSAASTPKIFFFSSVSWSRTFAACSNSRFLAWASIFFSSALISRAICFSLIDS